MKRLRRRKKVMDGLKAAQQRRKSHVTKSFDGPVLAEPLEIPAPELLESTSRVVVLPKGKFGPDASTPPPTDKTSSGFAPHTPSMITTASSRQHHRKTTSEELRVKKRRRRPASGNLRDELAPKRPPLETVPTDSFRGRYFEASGTSVDDFALLKTTMSATKVEKPVLVKPGGVSDHEEEPKDEGEAKEKPRRKGIKRIFSLFRRKRKEREEGEAPRRRKGPPLSLQIKRPRVDDLRTPPTTKQFSARRSAEKSKPAEPKKESQNIFRRASHWVKEGVRKTAAGFKKRVFARFRSQDKNKTPLADMPELDFDGELLTRNVEMTPKTEEPEPVDLDELLPEHASMSSSEDEFDEMDSGEEEGHLKGDLVRGPLRYQSARALRVEASSLQAASQLRTDYDALRRDVAGAKAKLQASFESIVEDKVRVITEMHETTMEKLTEQVSSLENRLRVTQLELETTTKNWREEQQRAKNSERSLKKATTALDKMMGTYARDRATWDEKQARLEFEVRNMAKMRQDVAYLLMEDEKRWFKCSCGEIFSNVLSVVLMVVCFLLRILGYVVSILRISNRKHEEDEEDEAEGEGDPNFFHGFASRLEAWHLGDDVPDDGTPRLDDDDDTLKLPTETPDSPEPLFDGDLLLPERVVVNPEDENDGGALDDTTLSLPGRKTTSPFLMAMGEDETSDMTQALGVLRSSVEEASGEDVKKEERGEVDAEEEGDDETKKKKRRRRKKRRKKKRRRRRKKEHNHEDEDEDVVKKVSEKTDGSASPPLPSFGDDFDSLKGLLRRRTMRRSKRRSGGSGGRLTSSARKKKRRVE